MGGRVPNERVEVIYFPFVCCFVGGRPFSTVVLVRLETRVQSCHVCGINRPSNPNCYARLVDIWA